MTTDHPQLIGPAEPITSQPAPSPVRPPALWRWFLPLLPLGYLWFHLLDNLRLEWSTNPQYSYGLVVPLLVAGLLLRRWQQPRGNPPTAFAPQSLLLPGLLGALLAFGYLPTRLIEAATPEWRPLQWALAIETIGITLLAIYVAGGKGWLRQAAFPLVFFLVAVPWPTPVEQPVIQGLSRLNATLVVNALGFLDVPAIQHGNVIEVGTGVVGINDACSGIRSLQSSLMISLFLGEFYRFNWRRRLLLPPLSLALALFLNVCRTSLLTWLAAKKGIDAIAQYHDEAGITILLVCTAMLWGTAWLLNHWRISSVGSLAKPTTAPQILPLDLGTGFLNRSARLGIALTVWLVAVDAGVELWYRIRESHLHPGPNWSVALPQQNPTFKTLPFTQAEHELLRFDQGKQGEWLEADGTSWQAFYYNWQPGRVAGYLAKRHTPDICMTATGHQLLSGPELLVLEVNHIELPMRHYVFAGAGGPLQVYQCHWEAGLGRDTYTANESSRLNLIRGIWAGRGNQGQKVLEIIIAGYNDAETARPALIRKLAELITVEN